MFPLMLILHGGSARLRLNPSTGRIAGLGPDRHSPLAGSAVIVALTLGYDTTVPVLASAAIGFVAAFPVSWAVAKKLAQG